MSLSEATGVQAIAVEAKQRSLLRMAQLTGVRRAERARDLHAPVVFPTIRMESKGLARDVIAAENARRSCTDRAVTRERCVEARQLARTSNRDLHNTAPARAREPAGDHRVPFRHSRQPPADSLKPVPRRQRRADGASQECIAAFD